MNVETERSIHRARRAGCRKLSGARMRLRIRARRAGRTYDGFELQLDDNGTGTLEMDAERYALFVRMAGERGVDLETCVNEFVSDALRLYIDRAEAVRLRSLRRKARAAMNRAAARIGRARRKQAAAGRS